MTVTLLQGDCLEVLARLPAGSVQTCVTSPPYYGLRDYGTASWEGGEAGCNHLGEPVPTRAGFNERYFGIKSSADNKQDALRKPFKQACAKCGAVRIDDQIGLEDTPEAYVTKLVAVFREVRRVLKDDGTLWLNIGDSYWNSTFIRESSSDGWANKGDENYDKYYAGNGGGVGVGGGKRRSTKHPELKPKDLIGIPWLLAFALRADGWWLRSEIIWHKPNPMPENVTDRPTKSHEQIFLLTKSAQYFYDAEAIAEKTEQIRGARPFGGAGNGKQNHDRNDYLYSGDNGTRNKRDVWVVTTQPYPEAHFATFPPDLIEPCILAGSREGDAVLDPFSGSGTTGAVAIKHHRDYVGIELNPKYIDLTRRRLARVQPVLFAEA